jgi:hypothetical protein
MMVKDADLASRKKFISEMQSFIAGMFVDLSSLTSPTDSNHFDQCRYQERL